MKIKYYLSETYYAIILILFGMVVLPFVLPAGLWHRHIDKKNGVLP